MNSNLVNITHLYTKAKGQAWKQSILSSMPLFNKVDNTDILSYLKSKRLSYNKNQQSE